MKNLLSKGSVLVGGLCVAGALPLSAASLYDNLTGGTDLGHVDPLGSKIGDQIVLTGTGGSLYDLSKFTFQYWGATSGSTFSGNAQVQVSFYANDGASFNGYSSPGTLLWQSTWSSLTYPNGASYPNHTAQLVYDSSDTLSGSLQNLPSSFTWAVQFTGLGSGESAGVDNFSRANGSAGMDYPDYWAYQNNQWQLLQYNNGSTPVNFGASFEGTVVPEPSTLALLGLSGLGLVALRRRQK